VPAAAVIPAPIVYMKVAAVKKLIVELFTLFEKCPSKLKKKGFFRFQFSFDLIFDPSFQFFFRNGHLLIQKVVLFDLISLSNGIFSKFFENFPSLNKLFLIK